MDETSKQQRSFKENCKRKNAYTQNQKKAAEIPGIYN